MSLFRLIPDKHDVLQDQNKPEETGTFKTWLYITIFQSSTKAGKIFDTGLFILIFSNIILLMLESVDVIAHKYDKLFNILDYFYLTIFTIEYILRLYCVQSARKYAVSFYGVIDMLAILPSYVEFFYPQWHIFMMIRTFRLLRIFRIFGMVKFLDESRYMMFALIRSFRKIMVFLFFVVLLTIFLGSFMYFLEYQHNSGFNNIPQSIYWAIVTITTVGYGDIAPVTPIGKIVASFIMILGYSIIAVPTGIMSAGFMREDRRENQARKCPQCDTGGHVIDAKFCSNCGTALTVTKQDNI